MNNIDDISKVKEFDKGKIYKTITLFPDQIKQAWDDINHEDFTPKECALSKNVVIAGMGGSALGGRVVDSLITQRCRVPIEVFTEYHIPNYVNQNSLVILSSYSGDTEETLSDTNEAIKKNAKIFGITTGGKLKEILKNNNFSSYIFDPKHNPSGQPRMALGYSISAIISILSKCDFINLTGEEVGSLIESLKALIKEFSIEKPAKENIAKNLSLKLKNKIPVIVSSEHLIGSSHSFKNLLNESAKTFSVLFDIPELNHHLMEGLRNPAEAKKYLMFVFIESDKFTPRVQKRYEITKEVVEKNEVDYITYKTSTSSKIEQIFEVVMLGMFVSFYLSCLYGVDPSKIPWVDYFKEELNKI